MTLLAEPAARSLEDLSDDELFDLIQAEQRAVERAQEIITEILNREIARAIEAIDRCEEILNRRIEADHLVTESDDGGAASAGDC